MQPPKIKVCNVNSQAEVDILNRQGVDIVGFRILKQDLGEAHLSNRLDAMRHATAERVSSALTMNRFDLSLIAGDFDGISIDYLCLHFDADDADIGTARAIFPHAKIAILRQYEDRQKFSAMPIPALADMVIFDWAAGGTGKFPPIHVLDNLSEENVLAKAFIAGGLNHVNVVRLLRHVIPFGLDLDSSVRDPETRQIDEHRVERFVRAVQSFFRSGSNYVPRENIKIPFPKVDKRPWINVSDGMITDNGVVANSRLISIINDKDPYRDKRDSVSQRIFNALKSLSQHESVSQRWLDAALQAYSSALYFPKEMLNSSIRYLHILVSREVETRITKDQPRDEHAYNAFHLFSNDPGALHEDYFRINEIHGRLDQDKHARIKGVEDLGRSISNLAHTIKSQHQNAKFNLNLIFKRPVWVMLADQSLSGHSMSGDLEKLLWLFSLRKRSGFRNGVIIVACQVMTEAALLYLRKIPAIKRAIINQEIIFESAMYLGDEYSILCETSAHIPSRQVLEDLRDLSRWFADEYIAGDIRLDRMKEQSGDNLEFGYRRAGLLLARQENCPTDSLPLLWYSGKGRSGIRYQGPFSRIHSRIDNHKIEGTSNLWAELQADKTIEARLEALAKEVLAKKVSTDG